MATMDVPFDKILPSISFSGKLKSNTANIVKVYYDNVYQNTLRIDVGA